MAAASVASYSSQPIGQGGTFSPLTMFECTISSATMLIDNMAVRDLLVAFKIVAQLHGHLLEVLDPTVQRLANVADEHSMCPPPANQSAPAPHLPGTSSTSTKLVATAATADKASSESLLIKPEALDSDDDCVLMEADLIFDQSQVSFGGGGGGGAGRSDSALASGDLSNEWKGVLRKAYRVLKDETGSNVFDFSLPYSARVNVLAANRVIDKALALSRQKPVNVDAWRTKCHRYLSPQYYKNWQYRHQKRHRPNFRVSASVKLNRRQKSYELMKEELDQPSRARFESVLTRDYTSSDEEGGTDLDSEMKVRSLPWESDELRAMKLRLDDVYLSRLADDKQRSEIGRLHRDPAVLSSRPPPSDSIMWAKNPAWIPPVCSSATAADSN